MGKAGKERRAQQKALLEKQDAFWREMPLRVVKSTAGVLLVFFILPVLVARDCYRDNRWPWQIF